jgi:ribosomal protein S12 methylthiotransferase accessory factor
MKIAVVGLGHTGRAAIRSLIEQGSTDFQLVDSQTSASAGVVEALRSSFPRAAFTYYRGGSGDQAQAPWLANTDVCLLCADYIDVEHCLAMNAACIAAEIPMIPGLGMGDVAQVGPIISGGAGPCLQCIDIRVEATLGRPALAGPYPPNPALAQTVGQTLAAMATKITIIADVSADNPVTYIWSNGTRTVHRALRTPHCPACGELEPLPAFATPGSLDVGDYEDHGPAHILTLEPRLVDSVMGVVRWVQPYAPHAGEPQIAHSVASIADSAWTRAGLEILAGGNDVDAELARGAALGEALDRLATSEPSRRHIRIEAYANVADHAISPERFDLFHEKTRRRRGFPYAMPDPGAPMSWVWGWSMAGAQPTLIPATRVFVPFTPLASGDWVDAANVTGCATGTSAAEAALGGLLEVIERDAFMIAWATRLPVSGIVLDEDTPWGVGPYIRAFKGVGIDVRCSTIVLDWSVPLVIAIAKPHDPAEPAAVVAAAADQNLATACRRALKELSANFAHVRHIMKQATTPQSSDAIHVRTQDAHALLYARPEMARHLEPWWSPPVSSTIPEPETGRAPDVLASIADRIIAGGGDVLLVDLSLPGLSKLGLWTVKTVVPEAYPMNFDAYWPQFGGRRIQGAPVDAGLVPQALPFDELNAIPHPFP